MLPKLYVLTISIGSKTLDKTLMKGSKKAKSPYYFILQPGSKWKLMDLCFYFSEMYIFMYGSLHGCLEYCVENLPG